MLVQELPKLIDRTAPIICLGSFDETISSYSKFLFALEIHKAIPQAFGVRIDLSRDALQDE